MRFPNFLPYAAALALAAGASLGAAFFSVRTIESSTLKAVDFALEENGHSWAGVDVDGLQVRLFGTAPSEATRFRALSVAGGIVDAARVIDNMAVEDPKAIQPPTFLVEMLRNDDGISLIGLLPAAADRAAIIERATKAAGNLPVTDLLESADYPVPEGWDDALEFGIEALITLPRSKISVAADRVEVTAISDSASQKRQLETALARKRPRDLTTSIAISAPRPVITPFTLRFLIDPEEGARFDACSAGSNEGRTAILAAASAAGLQGKAECTVGLGMPTKKWPDAVAEGIKALADLGGGSITFSDADVTLVALDTTPQSTFDRVVGELETALPEVFSLHSVLPEPIAIDGTGEGDGPPEFVITRSPEGQIQLRGRVMDERARVATESFARARFGSTSVYGAMRLDEDLPNGWAVRVLAAIEVLSFLNNGAVVAQPDFVSVRGTTGEVDAKAEIARILSEKLGEAENFEINVTYERKLDPLLNIPTPKECVAKINDILNATKINFAPGKAEINAEASDILDRIAVQMKECEDTQMEIGGHTDSQGRTEMNAQLSQARADAVLNALLARRVLTKGLTARGYGESQPIADNGSEEGRELNRRIEFKLISDVEDEAEEVLDETSSEEPADQTSETDTANE